MPCHLGGRKRIGTVRVTSGPGSTDGGGGYGCARCTSCSASWSNTDDPELATRRADVTLPCRSMLKATFAIPRLVRASDGYRLLFSRILLISFCHAGNGLTPLASRRPSVGATVGGGGGGGSSSTGLGTSLGSGSIATSVGGSIFSSTFSSGCSF